MYCKDRINRVYLMLGSACNFHCRYCIQGGDFQGYQHKIEQEINPDVYEYMHAIGKNRKLTIMYWGGEPLLYFDIIKRIVPCFSEAKHAIVSNGSLLTQSIVDFINTYEVNYIVSNDGPNSDKTRLVNILEDEAFLSLFKQIKHRAVDSVISAYCQDYQVLQDYIIERCGNETAQNSEFLLPSVVMPEDAYCFDYEAFRQSLRKRLDNGVSGLLSGKASQDFIHTATDLKALDNIDKIIVPRCGQMTYNLNLDLQGNIYACHNSTVKLGTIYDSDAKLDARYQQFLERQQVITKKGCDTCEAYELCRGGCQIIEPEAHGQEACCHLRRIYVQEVKRAHKIINDKIQDVLSSGTDSLDDAVRVIHERYEEGVDMIDGNKR